MPSPPPLFPPPFPPLPFCYCDKWRNGVGYIAEGEICLKLTAERLCYPTNRGDDKCPADMSRCRSSMRQPPECSCTVMTNGANFEGVNARYLCEQGNKCFPNQAMYADSPDCPSDMRVCAVSNASQSLVVGMRKNSAPATAPGEDAKHHKTRGHGWRWRASHTTTQGK